MTNLTVGDIVQNSTQQRAIVRWIGLIEEIPIIGLQSIDSTLLGYTDGVCPVDNNRYFECLQGQGYFILENGFNDSYKIIEKKKENSKLNTTDDEFNSADESLSTSPVNSSTIPKPISSPSSPIISRVQHNSDDNHVVSPPRGVLSRLTSEREQRKTQVSSSSIKSDPHSSRTYYPENYRSTSDDKAEESDEHENENLNSSFELIHNQNQPSSTESLDVPSFGQDYYLNNWTLGRLKNFLEKQISNDNYLCLNIYNDQCNVKNLIDEQINGCHSSLPLKPPNDIRIELIKLYDYVEIIFPSRAIRLYENDYLLLAIICSNNQCAYIRTSDGWAYTDDENDHGESIVVEEISQMIDDSNINIQFNSEQCRHVLKNASFLYYKLVE